MTSSSRSSCCATCEVASGMTRCCATGRARRRATPRSAACWRRVDPPHYALIDSAGSCARLAIQGAKSESREEARRLAEVRVGENETFESALRRFNKKIQQSGILAEARRREHYEKPSVKRKRKEAKKRKATRA